MAGIGFVLKKLVAKDDLLGIFRAFTHSTMASAGPWLFTVIALGSMTSLYNNFFIAEGLLNFRVILIFNFSFSLVLSAPIFMVVTRYLADNIHRQDVTSTPSVMIGCLFLLYIIQLPLAALYYIGYVDLPVSMQLSALANLLLVTTVWCLGVFMTALKDYNAVTKAFLIGMILALICAKLFMISYGEAGMINGYSIGLTYVVFTLSAKIFSEYPYKYESPFAMLPYFRRYWELAVGGICYNAAIWVDKWLMWFAPERTKLPSGMVMYPDYDSATFLAYLSIVPSLAVFMFSVETNFFERYQRFYENVLNHAPLRKIKEYQKQIIDSVVASARNFMVVQGMITFLAIVLAPQIYAFTKLNYIQIGIFRISCLGGFFHVLTLFEMIILSYFDSRRITMYTQAVYLLTNIMFTLWSMNQGFPYYGYGYFISSLLVFIVTSVMLFHYMRNLPYHAFVTNNTSLSLPKLEEATS